MPSIAEIFDRLENATDEDDFDDTPDGILKWAKELGLKPPSTDGDPTTRFIKKGITDPELMDI